MSNLAEALPRQDQFIDAAARALYDEIEPRDGRCGWCAFSAAQAPLSHETYVQRARIAPHAFRKRREAEDDDATPSHYRDTAAIFLGRLLQANGCELEEIVRAARAADCVCGDPSDYKEHSFTPEAFASALILEAMGKGKGWFGEHHRFKLQAVEPARYNVWCGRCSTQLALHHKTVQLMQVCASSKHPCEGAHDHLFVEPEVHETATVYRDFLIPSITFTYEAEEVGRGV